MKKFVGSRLEVKIQIYFRLITNSIRDKAYQAFQTLVLVISHMSRGKIYKLGLSLYFDILCPVFLSHPNSAETCDNSIYPHASCASPYQKTCLVTYTTSRYAHIFQHLLIELKTHQSILLFSRLLKRERSGPAGGLSSP